MKFGLELPPELVDAIAERAAELVVERLQRDAGGSSEWLSIAEAADYLRCERQRIYDLRSSGRLGRYSEGGRALIKRAELEALVATDELVERRRAA